jgi:hypothetical protein
LPQRSSNSGSTTNVFERANNARGGDNNDFMSSLEREVHASARVRMDIDRVSRALQDDYAMARGETTPEKKALLASQWKVSLAAAIFTGVGIIIVIGNWFLACLASVVVFVVANQDPLDEEGVAGSIARLVGRTTIQSVETATPKLRAMARAAITNEEEIKYLKSQIQELQQRNAELIRWKERRMAVDQALPYFSSDQLKDMARQNGLQVGGNRTQLLMRLVEAGVVHLQ